MFAYCLNKPVNMVDPTGTCGYIKGTSIWRDCGRTDCPLSSNFCLTVSIGVSFSITLGPFVYGFQIALVTDSVGYSEIQATYYSPISSDALKNTPSTDEMLAQAASYEKITDIVEFSLMGNMSFYNAPFASDLHNVGYQIGGAVNCLSSLGSGMGSALRSMPLHSTTSTTLANSLHTAWSLFVEAVCDFLGTLPSVLP